MELFNHITILPLLPYSIHLVSCQNNYITSIPILPESLEEFYIFGFNPIANSIDKGFGSWTKYRKFQRLMLKYYANKIGEWFMDCKMNPKYKYCRDRLQKEYEELYTT